MHRTGRPIPATMAMPTPFRLDRSTFMPESPVAVFERLVHTGPPGSPEALLDTAVVLGGSVAGLLAARVLAEHARRVVVLEPDELPAAPASRPGVPQDRQVHTLLPAGQQWLERWLPGITARAQEQGASFVPDRGTSYLNGVPQASAGAGHRLLAIGRPLLESLIRERVTATPAVSIQRARATGLRFRDDRISAVEHETGAGEPGTLAAEFVVDAMGRSSRMSHWLAAAGYDQPRLERLEAPVNYATALFERAVDVADLAEVGGLALFTPDFPSGGVSVAAAQPIEGMRWIVMLMGYGADRPGRTVEQMREASTKLPPVFATATAGRAIGEVHTYHQAESRRRHFETVRHYPAGLVGVGDAVASFNPIYGQGMSSAALHASCLAAYLTGHPDLGTTATGFFDLQQVVVDAAWAVSAGGDAARLDALNGTPVPAEVARQRQALTQLMMASLRDGEVAGALQEVNYMLRHPATLAG
jgi:2-polyprenyl-6-methoxyphenol hydroxylase-like FAD-dependent oxidoreductase